MEGEPPEECRMAQPPGNRRGSFLNCWTEMHHTLQQNPSGREPLKRHENRMSPGVYTWLFQAGLFMATKKLNNPNVPQTPGKQNVQRVIKAGTTVAERGPQGRAWPSWKAATLCARGLAEQKGGSGKGKRVPEILKQQLKQQPIAANKFHCSR